MRRRMRPVGRRGPGLIGTMARTAVVAGTATAAVKAVGGRMDASAEQAQQAQMADEAAFQAQADVQDLQQQMTAMQAQQAAPAAAGTDDVMIQLRQLAKLKEGGMLTDEEFAAAKAKILGG